MSARAWEIQQDTSGQIVATFRGHLCAEDGSRAASAFLKALGVRQHVVVFDLSAMTSYETGARKAWADMLLPRSARISRIKVRGGTALTRMGAATLAMILRVPISFA